MLNIRNENVQQLGSLLNTTDDIQRSVIYAGYSAALANHLMPLILSEHKGVINGNVKMLISDHFYEVNEIAILDKEALTAMIRKFIEFKLSTTYQVGINNSFNDVTGVNAKFGTELSDNIDANIDLFNKTFLLSGKVLKEMSE